MHKIIVERSGVEVRAESHEIHHFVVGQVGELALVNPDGDVFRIFAPGQWTAVTLHKDLGVAS